MIQIRFKKLERSQLAETAVEERLDALVEKFGDLQKSKIQVTLEMENSPLQAGPDLFKIKVQVLRGRYDGIIVEKSDPNLYAALAELVDDMLEVLNRFGDRERIKNRKKARKFTQELILKSSNQ